MSDGRLYLHNNAHLCKLKYSNDRRREEQVIQRAQLPYVVNTAFRGCRVGISCCVVVEQPIKQVLREHRVHWFSCAERLCHQGEHGENIGYLWKNQCLTERGKFDSWTKTYEVRIDDFSVSEEARSPLVIELCERAGELSGSSEGARLEGRVKMTYMRKHGGHLQLYIDQPVVFLIRPVTAHIPLPSRQSRHLLQVAKLDRDLEQVIAE